MRFFLLSLLVVVFLAALYFSIWKDHELSDEELFDERMSSSNFTQPSAASHHVRNDPNAFLPQRPLGRNDVTITGGLIKKTDKYKELWLEIQSAAFTEPHLKMMLIEEFLGLQTTPENYVEIRKLLLEEFGPGDTRDHLLQKLFILSLGLGSLNDIEKYLTLNDEEGFKMSPINVTGGISNHSSQSLINLISENSKVKEMLLGNAKWHEALAYALGPHGANWELMGGEFNADLAVSFLNEAVEFVKGSNLGELEKEKMLGDIARHYSSGLPFEAWALFNDNSPKDVWSGAVSSSAKVIFKRMIEVDFSKAVEVIADEGTISNGDRSKLLVTALEKDSEQFLAEFKKVESLPFGEDRRDSFASAFSIVAAKKYEFDSAWEWAEEIEDPVLQREAEGKISDMEKKVVAAQVRNSPSDFIGAIVSGDSNHGDYWIETAFSEWNTRSPELAAQWYEENRSALTPDQNQHFARVYADQAIDVGDMNLAREWLGQVTEDKFRREIEDKIKVVVGNSN